LNDIERILSISGCNLRHPKCAALDICQELVKRQRIVQTVPPVSRCRSINGSTFHNQAIWGCFGVGLAPACDAVCAAIKTPVSTFAAPVNASISAVPCPVETFSSAIVAMRQRPIATPIEAPVNPVTTTIGMAFDAIAALVDAIGRAFTMTTRSSITVVITVAPFKAITLVV
jgi:uncharacterized protein YqgV (UPF0045/DUF77 family)